jgi:hypothetical protein
MWLEDLDYEHEYRCPDEHISVLTLTPSMEVPGEVECAYCGQVAKYLGFRPQQMGGQLVVKFEKNGRIGYATTTGGKTTYMSETKLNYLKTGTNKSSFSKEYEQHTQDKMGDEFGKYRKQLETRATVSEAPKGALNEV